MNNRNSLQRKKRQKTTKSQRPIDFLAQDISSWWGKTFVFIKKTRIKTWKGVFVLAFSAGAAVAIVWTVSMNIQTSSKAASANLSLYTDDTAVTLESGSNLVNMDVLLDTQNNDVVATKAVVNFNPQNFELQSWSTANSVFASGNSCVYQGKPCEIVEEDLSNGKITITLAKPSPGVSTNSGIVAQLVFRAIDTTSPASPNFTLSYSSGSYGDSDVIHDDGEGTDILTGVTNAQVNVYTAVCTSFNYSEWSACQSSGIQTRTVISGIPSGCFGGNPELEQDCDYEGPGQCDEGSAIFSDWGNCQPNGTQTRTLVSGTPAGCSVEASELIQTCTYNPPPCVFSYSGWNDCQPGGIQTRTVTSQSPSGCVGTPTLTQSCQYNGDGGACVNFEYNEWGDCQPGGTQVRTVRSSNPQNCNGGEQPVLTQSCQYQNPAKPEKDDDDEKKEKKPKDKEKPRFTDLPLFLNKNRGDMVWWKAKDNKGIHHYRYYFNGGNVKTKKRHFFIPVNTKPGMYVLRVRAYDKAGNTKSRYVTIRVR